MQQYFRRLKRKKGFTITELIVVVALVGIMMATLTAFSGPVRDMVRNTRAQNDVLSINNIIGNYLEHNLSYASQITICAGWDLIQHKDALKTKFDSLKSTWATSNDRPAALIIHFEKGDSDLRNTFRLYEYDSKSELPNTTTEIDGVQYPVMDSNNLVFHKEFYNDYSFVITADDLIFHNNYREKAYARLNVSAYRFDGSIQKSAGVEACLDRGDAKTHYMNLAGAAPISGGTGVQTDLLTSGHFIVGGVGSESVFFPLQNINVSGNKYEYFRGYEDPTTHNITYGDDIVIFYNIRKYSYGKSSS